MTVAVPTPPGRPAFGRERRTGQGRAPGSPGDPEEAHDGPASGPGVPRRLARGEQAAGRRPGRPGWRSECWGDPAQGGPGPRGPRERLSAPSGGSRLTWRPTSPRYKEHAACFQQPSKPPKPRTERQLPGCGEDRSGTGQERHRPQRQVALGGPRSSRGHSQAELKAALSPRRSSETGVRGMKRPKIKFNDTDGITEKPAVHEATSTASANPGSDQGHTTRDSRIR